MARIRSIKPDIASDAKLAALGSDVFRTFILCISQADDYGLLVGSPRALAGVLYPATESVDGKRMSRWVDTLVVAGMMERLVSQDGLPVLRLTNWSRHQRIEKPSMSALSRSLDADTFAQLSTFPRHKMTDGAAQNDGSLGTDSPLEVGSRKGSRKKEEEKDNSSSTAQQNARAPFGLHHSPRGAA